MCYYRLGNYNYLGWIKCLHGKKRKLAKDKANWLNAIFIQKVFSSFRENHQKRKVLISLEIGL